MRSEIKATPCVLTVAGSDSGGGAGIQADLKTFTALGVYGATVLTALTAQNTVGVQAIHVPPTSFVQQQLQSVLSDIQVSVIKTGMLPNADVIRACAEAIRRYGVKKVVVDPVLVATSGDLLVQNEAIEFLKSELFPLATVVTPNLPEAEALTGRRVRTISDMRQVCRDFIDMGCQNVLLKGGHTFDGEAQGEEMDLSIATDILFNGKEFQAFVRPRVDTQNTHGTGCSLASAIAAGLARGSRLDEAVEMAKTFVFHGIEEGLEIGRGHGPLNHMHAIQTFSGKESEGT